MQPEVLDKFARCDVTLSSQHYLSASFLPTGFVFVFK
jgi:hypothetical protein